MTAWHDFHFPPPGFAARWPLSSIYPQVFTPESKPVVASYCADFLKSDMQHVYRQLKDLRRWEPRVLTHSRENETLFPWPTKKLRVLPKHPLRFFRRLWYRGLKKRAVVPPAQREVIELLYQILRFEASVVHVYFGHQAVRWLPMLKACPRPVVVSFHGADAAVGVTPEELREVFYYARLVLARSEALLADLAAMGCPVEKLRLQRTGVPLDFWKPSEVPCELPPEAGAWQFVQACRLVEKKGLTTTLRAFAEIVRAYPNARLTIMGDGPLRGRLESQTRELGLAGQVEFTGFLPPEAMLERMQQAHVFFHPSETTPEGNREGVPNSLLEAMAVGLPVLATRHGGIPEAVEHGVSGFLVAEKDHVSLANAALAMLNDPVHYAAMSSAAIASVRDNFERHAQTEILEACYDEAASHRAAPSSAPAE